MDPARSTLSAARIAELHQTLERRLETIGISSQPAVAQRLLALSTDPAGQLADYAKIIKNDQAVAGRVLRLANSAFFAQRRPVTAIDRACVVLGIDRLKAVSLGFHLSRAAQAPGEAEYSRRIWGESLYRACLASELARCAAPSLVSEAFVIGLMMDAGMPIACRLLGEPFRVVRDEGLAPGGMLRRESDLLPFTHVDVITVLARKWKFPELLAKPLEWHHTRPGDLRRDEPMHRLHRIAYVVGGVRLEVLDEAGRVKLADESAGIGPAQAVLSLSDSDMGRVVHGSFSEYSATIDMFKEVATKLSNLDELAEAVQLGLSKAVDQVIEDELARDDQSMPLRVMVDGQSLEIRRDPDGGGVAYLYDSAGNRLLSHRFAPTDADARRLCEALGIEPRTTTELDRIRQSLTRMAA